MKKHTALTLILLVFVCTYFVQKALFMNADVAWLFSMSRAFMHGAHYYTNYIETNPPLIIYIDMLVLLLHHLCSLWLANQLVVYFFVAVSLYLSSEYLKRPIHLLICAFVVLLLIPGVGFAQREHFTVIFILPYLALVSQRVSGSAKEGKLLSCIVGFWGALGFMIKPYFILPLLVLWAYHAAKRRHLNVLISCENLGMLLALLSYALAILIFDANYFHYMIPIVLHFYSGFGRTSLGGMLSHLRVDLPLLTLLVNYLLLKEAVASERSRFL